MYVVDQIFSYVWDIADWFYSAYQTVKGWWWPFNFLQYPLYSIWRAARNLVTPIAQFGEWADYVAKNLGKSLSLSAIKNYLRKWLDYAADAWSWVVNSFWNVWHIVDDWWSSTMATVQGWIAMATEGLNALRVAWDNFRTTTLPDLVSFKWLGTWWNTRILDIQAWINSAFLERDSWWAGWVDFRDKVAEFFDDPVEFIWGLFADWFLGPEE